MSSTQPDKFKSFLNTFPDGFACYQTITDNDGPLINFIFLDVNPAFEKITGLSRDQIIGKTNRELDMPEDVVEAWEAALRFVFENNKMHHVDISFDTAQGEKFYHSLFTPEITADKKVVNVFNIIRDITELKQAENNLQESENKLKNILNNVTDVIWSLSWPEMEYIYLSPSVETIYGHPFEECMQKSSLWQDAVHPEDRHLNEKTITQLLKEGTAARECRIIRPDGSIIWINDRSWLIYDDNHTPISIEGITSDITDRKQKELYQGLSGEVFGILNESADFQDLIQRILNAVKQTTDTDAVGMRLQNGDDFPYYIQDGFSDDFLREENSLACRNSDGSISLECTCGLVISGKTDPSNPLFTPGGSCWTNDSSTVIDIPASDDPRLNPRNNCIHRGFASVALIPIRKKKHIVGLLQLNSRRKNHFTRDAISILEGIASHIGEALIRKQAEEELKKSSEKLAESYRKLDEEVNKAVKIHQRILPKELPQTENISIAAHNQPTTKMGGDSYNVIKSGNKLIIYVADVMGHGLDGAMISVFIKEAIDSYIVLKPEQLNPQKILQHLNNQYHRELFPDKQLIAIFLAVLNIETYDFVYSCAGFQTEPLVRMGNRSKEILDATGIFISNCVPRELLTFDERSLKLTPGTTMLISTDGLSEQDSGEEMFHEIYKETFYQNSHLTPEFIVQAINKEFCSFNNDTLVGIDDITYLVLQVSKNTKETHHLKIKSNFDELDTLYQKISALNVEFHENSNLITCLHEIVVNAIEHGNKLDPEKIVKINLTVTPEFILIEVEDEGEGFNWCNKLKKPINIDSLNNRGRGIALTDKLMSGNLYYNYRGNKATLLIQNIFD